MNTKIEKLLTACLLALSAGSVVMASNPQPAKTSPAKPKSSASANASKSAPSGAKPSTPPKSNTSISPGTKPLAKPSAAARKPATTAKKPAGSTANKSRVAQRVIRPPVRTVPVPAVVTAAGKPIWLNVKQAQYAAKVKKKMILADFYTDWCGWCKVLDKNTFHDPTVESYLGQNFVCMKVNAQDGADGEELAKRFEISGFPTVMIFQSNGRKLGSIEGYRDPKEFLDSIKEIVTPQKSASKP